MLNNIREINSDFLIGGIKNILAEVARKINLNNHVNLVNRFNKLLNEKFPGL